jgi:RimJ/RimL family protein N-acetyltransferase
MQINTPRLILREFVPDDWQAVLAYHNDPRYLRFYPQESEGEYPVRAFVQRFVDQELESPRQKFQLAVCLAGSGQLIGNAGVRLGGLGPRQPESRQGDIGYEIAPAFWGQGYATEAARAMLDFGFTNLRLHRIWARCLAENTASQRVLEKLGMRLEGRLRQDEYFKGRWWDTLIYAILEDER